MLSSLEGIVIALLLAIAPTSDRDQEPSSGAATAAMHEQTDMDVSPCRRFADRRMRENCVARLARAGGANSMSATRVPARVKWVILIILACQIAFGSCLGLLIVPSQDRLRPAQHCESGSGRRAFSRPPLSQPRSRGSEANHAQPATCHQRRRTRADRAARFVGVQRTPARPPLRAARRWADFSGPSRSIQAGPPPLRLISASRESEPMAGNKQVLAFARARLLGARRFYSSDFTGYASTRARSPER